MKRAVWACWIRRRCMARASAWWRGVGPAPWRFVTLVTFMAFMACMPFMPLMAAEVPAPQAQHITQARVFSDIAERFTPPPAHIDTQALERAGWQTVALPYLWERQVIPQGHNNALPVRTTWLQVDLAPHARDPRGTWLYLPRWQTVGQIAVYGDGALLYRSQADRVWNGFNHPLRIALDDEGMGPMPARLTIRIDSQASAGGALSSLWTGPATALDPAWRWRTLLQTRVPEVASVVLLALGLFAFLVWLRRPGERLYLLFVLFAVLSALRNMHFHMGLEPLPMPSDWFGWITVNTVHAILVTWYLFVRALVPRLPRWPVQALLVLLAVSCVATLPVLQVLPGMDTLAPLLYALVIMGSVPAILLMAWSAMRHGGAEGRLAAGVALLDLPVAVHDWMMQNYLLGPEGMYLWPVVMLARLVVFVFIIVRRYVQATRQVEATNARLAQQLAARERELAHSHERLRAVQHRQTLQQERQRLMQDIHDGLGSQLMSALKVTEQGQLGQAGMSTLLRECIDDLKLTVDSLEPVEADLVLLLATLRYRLGPRLQGAGLRLRWDVQPVPPLDWLDPRAGLHVLRILQEGISNVMQHAHATELRLSTGMESGGIVVALADDGKPFLPREGGAGKGLSNMQRRARALGARVQWTPLATGTRFTLWLPLRQATRPAPEPGLPA